MFVLVGGSPFRIATRSRSDVDAPSSVRSIAPGHPDVHGDEL
jgi:hypothetical protein